MKIWFISDLHLDHFNIIKYCNRPFRDVGEMNRHIVGVWNSTVAPDDTIFFIGDMAFGRGSRPASYWTRRLNGHIIFIKGSHDRDRGIHYYYHLFLNVGGQRVLLIHNPWDIPEDWNGWVVHGHVHNNRPFLDRERKLINVSAEVLDYRPISIENLEKILNNGYRH